MQMQMVLIKCKCGAGDDTALQCKCDIFKCILKPDSYDSKINNYVHKLI